ncbi:MAG: monovalent cation/H+ antiporter complex subunit F [Gaiellaceae bacterium]
MNAWLVAATALAAGLLPLALVAWRARPIEGVIALQLGGTTTALALLCLGEGFHQTTYFGVGVLAAVLTWLSSLVFARFLGRD